MNILEYKLKVIQLFKSGKASEDQWNEMAEAVLKTSESNNKITQMIDKQINACECPSCLKLVDPEELKMFGGFCKNCFEKIQGDFLSEES